jgi:L-amino acid N-acyltransferase
VARGVPNARMPARTRRRATAGPVRVRPARSSDAGAIRAIYNEAVATTTATFDTEPRSPTDQRRWMQEHAAPYAVLVAERGGSVLGWASISAWSPRRAYAGTAEVSEYVRAEDRGRGVGSRLLARLVRIADRRGFHTLLARVADGNRASLRLHARFGFRRVGVMREVGWKFGRRLDVHLLQRISPGPTPRRSGPAARSPGGNRPL